MTRLAAFALLCLLSARARAADPTRTITITTARSALVLAVGKDGRLHQLGYGRSRPIAVPEKLAPEDEVYPASGSGFIGEPALQVVHADGNTSTELAFVSHQARAVDRNVTHTTVKLKDRFYPFFVTLHFEAFRAEDVIRQWVELSHGEEKPVVLARFASSAPPTAPG
jgi:alpha-galactosidase